MASLIRRFAAEVPSELYPTYAMMLASLAWTLARLGYIDQARSRLEEALSEARQLRRGDTLGRCAPSCERSRFRAPRSPEHATTTR